jgi:predicted dienelactone hydrolase
VQFVGFEEINVKDQNSHASFPMLMMYPTQTPSQTIQRGPYKLEVSAHAPIQDGAFPLVIISHGSGGTNITFRNLAAFLVKKGFIVAMPEHPFNNRTNNERHDTIENMVERPRHISQALDLLFQDPKWSTHLKKEKVAMIGHSMGAYTALAIAGGIPHTKHQIEYDPKTKIKSSQEIAVTPDPRVKCLLLLAPAAGWYLSEGALEKVKTPIYILTGELDHITPGFHAEIIKKGIPNKAQVTHKEVKNAGHFSFLSPFPPELKRPEALATQDPEGFDREKYQAEFHQEVFEYLQSQLTKNS